MLYLMQYLFGARSSGSRKLIFRNLPVVHFVSSLFFKVRNWNPLIVLLFILFLGMSFLEYLSKPRLCLDHPRIQVIRWGDLEIHGCSFQARRSLDGQLENFYKVFPRENPERFLANLEARIFLLETEFSAATSWSLKAQEVQDFPLLFIDVEDPARPDLSLRKAMASATVRSRYSFLSHLSSEVLAVALAHDPRASSSLSQQSLFGGPQRKFSVISFSEVSRVLGSRLATAQLNLRQIDDLLANSRNLIAPRKLHESLQSQIQMTSIELYKFLKVSPKFEEAVDFYLEEDGSNLAKLTKVN